MTRTVPAAVLACLLATGAANAAVIDLDALVDGLDNPFTLLLDAGTYDVTPILGTYTAWHPWGTSLGVAGCDVDGTGCITGWHNQYTFSSQDVPTTVVTNGGFFSTAEQAFAAALPSFFTLPTQQTVSFFISDSLYPDNTGGMSLLLTARDGDLPVVPLPGTLALFLSAALTLAGVRRARHA